MAEIKGVLSVGVPPCSSLKCQRPFTLASVLSPAHSLSMSNFVLSPPLLLTCFQLLWALSFVDLLLLSLGSLWRRQSIIISGSGGGEWESSSRESCQSREHDHIAVSNGKPVSPVVLCLPVFFFASMASSICALECVPCPFSLSALSTTAKCYHTHHLIRWRCSTMHK